VTVERDPELIRQPAEIRCQHELAALAAHDRWPKPPGWRLSPRMVETFILGSEEPLTGASSEPVAIAPKFVGDRRLVQVAIATLASDRALLLTGEPGTAKSWLSEHLAAAISGTSGLTIQGTAGTTEEQIKYGWNYALLIAEGPTRRALVESPILRGMNAGQLVRFEELTRCSAEVQDCLISVLSEQQVVIPELNETVSAKRGFSVIATANTRDRGVNDMSAALKRRFNFVTIPVIGDLDQEAAIVARRSRETLYQLGADDHRALSDELIGLLTTVFAELRNGISWDGTARIKSPSTVLSTAELISTVTNSALMSSFFGNGEITIADAVGNLVSAIVKEQRDDLKILNDYLETVVKPRQDGLWPELYRAGRELAGS
jgi:MoxR-like ATPase